MSEGLLALSCLGLQLKILMLGFAGFFEAARV